MKKILVVCAVVIMSLFFMESCADLVPEVCVTEASMTTLSVLLSCEILGCTQGTDTYLKANGTRINCNFNAESCDVTALVEISAACSN